MNIHKNARLTPLRREEMAVAVLDGRLTKAQAACVYGVSRKIVSRWVERFEQGGRAAMTDRSSRPKNSPRRTDAILSERIAELRRQRLTGKHIAQAHRHGDRRVTRHRQPGSQAGWSVPDEGHCTRRTGRALRI